MHELAAKEIGGRKSDPQSHHIHYSSRENDTINACLVM